MVTTFVRRSPKAARGGLLGYLPETITVEQLTEVFGPPEQDTDPYGKTKHEWVLQFDDGTVAAIYDYKGHRWHVGGLKVQALNHVLATCRENGVMS